MKYGTFYLKSNPPYTYSITKVLLLKMIFKVFKVELHFSEISIHIISNTIFIAVLYLMCLGLCTLQ